MKNSGKLNNVWEPDVIIVCRIILYIVKGISSSQTMETTYSLDFFLYHIYISNGRNG